MRACLTCLLLVCAAPAPAEDAPRYLGKPLSEWLPDLDSARGEIRNAAIEAVAQFGPAAKEAVPALLHMLKDRGSGSPNTLSGLGEAAVEALAQIGTPAVPALLDALRSDYPRIRGGAAQALGYVRPRALHAVDPLKKLLEDDDEFVRVSVATALWRLERKADSVVPTLAASLRAMSPELRQRAVLELGELGPPARAAIPALVAALRDEALEEPTPSSVAGLAGSVRPVSAAVRTLAIIGPESAPALVKAAGDRNPNIRTAALLSLSSMPTSCKDVTPALTRALQDRDPSVRVLAAINLWRRDGEVKRVLPVLLDALQGSERELADAAAFALARIGEPAHAAVPILLKQLPEPETHPRSQETLRLMGSVAVPALIRELSEKDHGQWVIHILQSMLPHALPAVLKALESDNARVRAGAAEVLTHPGGHAARAVPALREAARDIDARVRFEALVGLARLDLEGSTDAVVAALIEFVKVKDSPFRSRAIATLGQMGPRARKAAAVLLAVAKVKAGSDSLEAETSLVQIQAEDPDSVAHFLTRMKEHNKDRDHAPPPLPPSAFPALAEMARSPSIQHRQRAVRALSEMVSPPPEVVPLLIRALADADINAWEFTLESLARLGPKAKDALPTLGKQLEEDHERQRTERLLKAAARIDPEKLILVRKAVRDEKLRWRTLSILYSLEERAVPALPELRAALKDASATARRAALGVLAQLGRHARPALADIRDALNDKEPEVQSAASSALIALTGRAGESLPWLEKRMKSPDIDVRRNTADSVGAVAVSDPAVLPLLTAALVDRDAFTPLPLPPPGAFSNQFGAPGQLGGQLGQIGQIGQIGALGGGARGRGSISRQFGVFGGGGAYGDMGGGVAFSRTQATSVRQKAAPGLGGAGPAARASVPVLLKLLGSDMAIDRYLAATTLGAIGPRAREAVPALRKALADYDRSVRIAAAQALTQLDREGKEALRILLAALPEERKLIGQPLPIRDALVRLGKTAVPPLIVTLRDRPAGPHVGDAWGLSSAEGKFASSWLVAETLGLIGPEAVEAVPALLEAVEDRGADILEALRDRERIEVLLPRLRVSAATALGKIGHGAIKASPALLNIARNPTESAELRLAATEAAWRIEKAKVVPIIRELLHAQLLAPQLTDTFSLLREIGPAASELVPLLVGALKVRPETNRVEVARLLGWIGKDASAAVPALREMLKADSAKVRSAAAVALWRIEGKGAAEVVGALLDEFPEAHGASSSSSGNRRVEIVAALREFGPEAKKAGALLEFLLDDLDPLMRVTAASTLWQLNRDARPVLPVLSRGLENGDPQVRRKAAETLGDLAAQARPALEALHELREDAERDVRAAATAAVKKIESGR